MHTLTIETKNEATTNHLIWLLDSLKYKGIRIISKKRVLPVSKHKPNTETLASFEEARTTQIERMTIEEFDGLCQ